MIKTQHTNKRVPTASAHIYFYPTHNL